MKKLLLLPIVAFVFIARGETSDPVGKAQEQARTFAEAYYNYDFERALRLATPESAKWLRFASSNVTSQDVDLYNSQTVPASADVEDFLSVDDSTMVVVLSVHHFVQKDTIGKEPAVINEARCSLTVVTRDGRQLVKMACLPQSEKQSPGSVADE